MDPWQIIKSTLMVINFERFIVMHARISFTFVKRILFVIKIPLKNWSVILLLKRSIMDLVILWQRLDRPVSPKISTMMVNHFLHQAWLWITPSRQRISRHLPRAMEEFHLLSVHSHIGREIMCVKWCVRERLDPAETWFFLLCTNELFGFLTEKNSSEIIYGVNGIWNLLEHLG